MFKQMTILLIILLAFGFIFPGNAVSQTRADLFRAIEKLNADLRFAKDLVQAFHHNRARDLVLKAERLRNEAVVAVKNNKFTVAGNKVKIAFSLIQQAVKLTLDGPVRRWRSRLEELLRRADHEVLGHNYKEAERILREAKKNRNRAEKAFANKNVRKAIEHYRVAVTLAERALEMVRKANKPTLDTALEQKKRFEILRDRAEDLVNKSSNAQAKHIFNQAIKLYQSAEQAVKNGNFQLAKKFYNQSILLLLRAMDIAKGNAPESIKQAEIALYRLRELIDNSRELIQNANIPRAKILFERANRFANEAELSARNGRNHEALWKIELAENMINRARRISQNRAQPKVAQRLSQEIENTKLDILEIESRVTSNSPKDVGVLINMSKLTIRRAEQSAAAGHNRLALESVLAAQRFITKAESLLNTGETSTISKDRVQIRLNQLDAAISEAGGKIDMTKQDASQRLFEGAKDMRKFVVESLQKGNYRAADEGIQVAFDLLSKSLKNVSNE